MSDAELDPALQSALQELGSTAGLELTIDGWLATELAERVALDGGMHQAAAATGLGTIVRAL